MKIETPKNKENYPREMAFQKRCLLAKEDEFEICQMRVEGDSFFQEDFSNLRFGIGRFKDCRFSQCNFEKVCFTDITFENCDFSGCDFSESYFCRCGFDGCKTVGTIFTKSVQKNIAWSSTNMEYCNCDEIRWERVQLKECSFNFASITHARIKNTIFDECSLIETSFVDTPLKGLDFSTCMLKNIGVSDHLGELRGMKVSYIQGAELAKFLGIEIIN